MPKPILEIANILFFVAHTLLILFNVFGWIDPRWRKANLITLLLTAFSWFILGIWYGWGYCICVDWHWQIRESLGYENASSSYIHFLIMNLMGIEIPRSWVDTGTVLVFFLALALSCFFNIRKWISK
jgi:hypothetical protein